MKNFFNTKIGKLSTLGISVLICSMILATAGMTAIKGIYGLSVHAGSNKWNTVADGAVSGDNLTSGTFASQMYIWDATNSNADRLKGTNGVLSVSPSGTNTPSDNYTNPTDATNNISFTMGWDGSAWDRIGGTSTAGLDVNVVNASSITSSSNIVALNAVSATGTGASTTLTSPLCKHTWTVKTTGTPTNVIVLFEGSLDDTDYFTLDTANLTTATFSARHVIDKCVKYIRGNLTTLTGGTTPTITTKIVSTN